MKRGEREVGKNEGTLARGEDGILVSVITKANYPSGKEKK